MTIETGAAIRVLPPEVAARIAAGEVIARPASVVKELVENALDAGARSIEVLVEDGGVSRIRVRDDGCGIPPEQLVDALERHATSKLRQAEDLFAIRTLGFRGEALASIVAAAAVDLVTRPAGQEAAALARARDGRLAHLGAAAAAPGTTVEARDLFAALPARRRFLRSPRAETRAIAEAVADAALAHPEVAFRLVADGRTLLASPGTGDLRDGFAAVHGEELAAALLPVGLARAAAPDAEDAGARVEVSGLVSAPSAHRAARTALHLVANGRPIASRALAFAVERAYEGLLPSGRHPAGVVRIEAPPEQVDVNVHPQKAEVRFRHERFVASSVTRAVREALAGAGVAAWPEAGLGVALPGDGAGSEVRSVIAGAQAASGVLLPADLANYAPAPWRLPEDGETSEGAWFDKLTTNGNGNGAGQHAEAEEASAAREPSGTGTLRALGQVDATYLVAEGPDGVVLVDQHAAHERVLYERVLAERAARGRSESQPLLAAVVASLSGRQAALAAEEGAALEALGWALEPTDGAALIVRAVPAALGTQDPARALVEFLDRLEAEDRLSGPDRAAATLACRAAVRAGDRLEAPQQRALLEALERCTHPQTCPHGRPTLLSLTREALDRSFGRPERGRRG